MKIALCALAALCAPLPLLAGPDTAYQALRVISAQRGDDALRHVIQVAGQAGVPQPVVWRVVLDDPTARGGVRELDVAHGKIIAEHTPVSAYSGSAAGAVIDFHKLNLDSSGAFTVTETEAQKQKVGFDFVDYVLRTGDGPDASPIWVIHVMDGSRHSLGTISLAADTGVVVSNNLTGKQPPEVAADTTPPDYTVQETDHDNLYDPAAEPSPVRQEDAADTEDTQGLHIGHRIKHAFIAAGISLKNFFTGGNSSDR
jgi:hypothetical protein